LRNIFTYIILLSCLNLQGQIFGEADTIPISEVVIEGRSDFRSASVYKTITIDSSLIAKYSHRTIADLISENSTIYVKSYGPGGISTPSFRGTSAGHTLIAWNGLDINNPMPGQFDLSLVPAGFIDQINIYYGAGSLEVDKGGLGGIIDLQTRPQWTGNSSLTINPMAGNYGRYSGLVKLNTVNNRFLTSTRIFIQNSENNFRYFNTGKGSAGEWERRENSQVFQKSIMHEMFLKNKKNGLFSGRFWYQSTDRNLPVPISVEPVYPPEKQYDESFRGMFDYKTPGDRSGFKITAAILHDKLRYLNEYSGIDSRNTADNIILKTEIFRDLNNKTRLKFELKDQLSIINSNNYQNNSKRNLVNTAIISETSLNRRLTTRLLLRGSLLDDRFLLPDFSAAAQIRILASRDYFIKLNVSGNSKIPSLNDMYWSPGGNPALKNENALLFEVGWDMNEEISSSISIKTELTLYKNFIDNLIQWHPGESTYWVADNLKKIETTGFESGLSMVFNTSGIDAIIKVNYAYTKAVYADQENINDGTERKQIIYVPANKLNTLLKVKWDHFYSGLNTGYVGRRFLTTDNTQYLPGYALCDLIIGMILNSGKTSWNMSINADNIFNQRYQNVAWYPMPGRSFSISLLIQLPV
jgi:iron complex outermembrane receptor protein